MKNKKESKLDGGIKSSNLPTVDVDENDTSEGVATVQLYNPVDCLRCPYLLNLSFEDTEAWKAELVHGFLSDPACHYSKGNPTCPAESIRLVKYVDIDKAVDTYFQVLAENNPLRMASYMDYVSTKDSSTSKLIMTRIMERTNSAQRSHVEEEPTPTVIDTTPSTESESVTSNIEELVTSPDTTDESEEQKT